MGENEESSLLSSTLPLPKSLPYTFLDSRLAKAMGMLESVKKSLQYKLVSNHRLHAELKNADGNMYSLCNLSSQVFLYRKDLVRA